MRTNIDKRKFPLWLTAVLCLALSALGIAYFAGVGTKWVTLLVCLGSIALIFSGDFKRLCNLPSLLLLGYALFSWLTIFWAMSGKFHLREWSKILIALAVFLLIVLRERFDRAFARRVMGVIAGMSAIYALASVEAAATGVCKALVMRLPGAAAMQIGFDGSRLYGIFGNSNIEASLYAIGILFSVALLCGSEKKWQRVLYSVALSFNAFSFLLVFSMGAVACFVAAVVVYLIFAGRGRGAALLRMLETAVPTVALVFFTAQLWDRSGATVIPLVLMLVSAAVTVVLELLLAARLSAVLEKHQRLAFGVLIGVAVCAAVYIFAGLHMSAPHTFGETLMRTCELSAGEHVIALDADGEISVEIYSVSRRQVMTGGWDRIFTETTAEGRFVVPEDSESCTIFFSAEPGTVIRSATIDGSTKIMLKYRLFPDFVAYRLQGGLTTAHSSVQRFVLMQDGLKLFRLSPIIGNGVGSFETGITAVQDYPFESKYVHNHYIQILLEDGVIGFALYFGALVTLAAALWKKRKQVQESELCWLYPALCAEFVMNGAQMLWDVSMSMIVFVCMTYATYGLIVRAFAEPVGAKQETEADTKKRTKKQMSNQPDWLLLRIGLITMTGLFTVTLCGNLIAAGKIDAQAPSLDVFMGNLSSAAKLDLYERNDAKLSYVMASMQDETGKFISQANAYAKELSRVQSNTIPRYLVSYYLQTGQYAEAIDEAMLGATYSATNADTWNECAALLKQAFIDSKMFSPLLTDGETLIPKLIDYYHALQAHNASALVPVELDENAQGFFDKVLALSDCLGDPTAFAVELLTEENAG